MPGITCVVLKLVDTFSRFPQRDKLPVFYVLAVLQTNFLTKNGWFLQNDVINQNSPGMPDRFNQSYWLWNAGIGKKFSKKPCCRIEASRI